MPHLQILEKVITFVYMNEDFFNGEHRLMVDAALADEP